MDSMGKKTVFACGVAVGVGSVVIGVRSVGLLSKILRKIRWKKALNYPSSRLEDVRLRKPIEQKVVVINDQTLQKLNKCKWISVSSNEQPSDYIETRAPFLKVKPSLQATPYRAACDGNIIYLLGGRYFPTSASRYYLSDIAYGIDVTNVVSGKTKEHIHQFPRMIVSQRILRAAVTSERRIYAFGRKYVAYGVNDHDLETSTIGEMYDMDEKCWTSFEQLPFERAPQCTVLGCVMWHSMIVLFLQRIKEGDDDDDDDDCKMVTTVSYYDLKEEKWISTVVIDEDDDLKISTHCFPVLVDEDDIVFIVQSSGFYRYDLVEERITGKLQGLKKMEELTEDGISDVVYLGSSCSERDDKKYLKFCIFWEGYNLPENDRFMRFAIIKVGDDDLGDKLTVRISSSVGSIPLYRDDRFIKGAYKIIRDKHMMFDESQARHEEEEETEEDKIDYIPDVFDSY